MFPLDRWSIDTVFNFGIVKNSKLCKICDKWFLAKDQEDHIKSHTAQWLQVVDQRREEAKRKRIEALKRRAEEKKLGA